MDSNLSEPLLAQDQEESWAVSTVDREIVKETNKGVRQVEQDLRDLRELQHDMRELVGEGQEQLADVENVTGEALEATKGTNTVLEKAAYHQKRARIKMIIAAALCALCIFIVLVVVIIIIVIIAVVLSNR